MKLAKPPMTALDVLFLAISREREAYLLYKHILGKVKNSLIKERLKSLAKEEAYHEKVLRRIYEKETGEKLVSRIAGNKTPEREQIKSGDVFELMYYAIKKEREAAKFYRDNARLFKDQSSRFMLEYLAGFEKGHELALEEELKVLKRYPDCTENDDLIRLTHIGP